NHVRLQLIGLTVEQRTAMDVYRAGRWRRHEFYWPRRVVNLLGDVLSESKSRQQREKTKRDATGFQHAGNSSKGMCWEAAEYHKPPPGSRSSGKLHATQHLRFPKAVC